MRVPESISFEGAQALRALTNSPAAAVVGLDFDGTLSPIVADPAQARPAPGATSAVRRLASVVGAVAIVTGRPAEVAAALLGLDTSADGAASGIVVLGHYGLERWTAARGLTRRADVDIAAIAAVRAELPAVLDDASAAQGTAIEDKGESLAVHVRRTADPAAALEVLREPLRELAETHGLRLEPGRMVWELRPAGVDKGIALDAFAREHAARAVCYIGDDLGDLAAFDALARLRADGVATLAVCSTSDDTPDTVPELAARADLVVAGPTAVVAFLNDIADAACA